MNKQHDGWLKSPITFLIFAVTFGLSACGGGSSDVDNTTLAPVIDADGSDETGNSTDNTDNNTDPNTSYTYSEVNGRVLASQCFQCHGTNGKSVNGWDSIAGESYNEIMEELDEYPVTHIMGAQAIGYTLQERQDLATYLAALPR